MLSRCSKGNPSSCGLSYKNHPNTGISPSTLNHTLAGNNILDRFTSHLPMAPVTQFNQITHSKTLLLYIGAYITLVSYYFIRSIAGIFGIEVRRFSLSNSTDRAYGLSAYETNKTKPSFPKSVLGGDVYQHNFSKPTQLKPSTEATKKLQSSILKPSKRHHSLSSDSNVSIELPLLSQSFASIEKSALSDRIFKFFKFSRSESQLKETLYQSQNSVIRTHVPPWHALPRYTESHNAQHDGVETKVCVDIVPTKRKTQFIPIYRNIRDVEHPIYLIEQDPSGTIRKYLFAYNSNVTSFITTRGFNPLSGRPAKIGSLYRIEKVLKDPSKLYSLRKTRKPKATL